MLVGGPGQHGDTGTRHVVSEVVGGKSEAGFGVIYASDGDLKR